MSLKVEVGETERTTETAATTRTLITFKPCRQRVASIFKISSVQLVK